MRSRLTKIAFCFSFVCLAVTPRMDGARRYSVTDLGDFAGGEDYSQALDINASSQVVGVGRNSTRFRAFLSSIAPEGNAVLVDLGALPQLPSTRANGINASGQIVGSSSDGDKSRAFLWQPAAANSAEGSMTELPGLPGERNSASATSINGAGQVVGYSRGHAWLWTPNVTNGTTGTAIDLGGLPEATGSLAIDINDSGQVAGISFVGAEHAFRWTPSQANGPAGSIIDLGGLPGGTGTSQATAINLTGAVAGNSFTATGQQHAVLWKPNASGSALSIIDLGDLAGGNDLSSAFGVNAANEVVGNSNSADSDHAFLWTETDGMQDLNTLTDATGAPWILRYAQSINDGGQIVGWGTFDPDGPGDIPPVTHAFRLEPVDDVEPAKLANISTRLRVFPGDNALIGGFIITGTEPKKVIIRGLGPSLRGVVGALANPALELHRGDTLIAQNDDWKETQGAEIAATTIAPSSDLESAIVRTLEPGAYTAILRGPGQSSGTALIEVYDLGAATTSSLGNISTRGFVGSGDDVMIGGLIVAGDVGQRAKVIVRAIGPSLSDLGVPGALPDPTLELYGANGTVLASNDHWRVEKESEILASGFALSRDAESAVIETLSPGNYTAIVRGKNGQTGVGLIEVYHLQ
ncbi:MAG TPA: hypothetical protein VM940_16735 [Chthoniobacterales bacterium]|nr:hypothetical protein [Chthoniobacterales bacterium]